MDKYNTPPDYPSTHVYHNEYNTPYEHIPVPNNPTQTLATAPTNPYIQSSNVNVSHPTTTPLNENHHPYNHIRSYQYPHKSTHTSYTAGTTHRPSVHSKTWEYPKTELQSNKNQVPLSIDVAASLGKSIITLGSFLYPSYMTYRVIENRQKNRKQRDLYNMLIFWTVNSAQQALCALSDIWLQHYLSSEKQYIYTLTSLTLKVLPSLLGPERVYKYYIRPFYRAYVEEEAEKLITEIDEIKKRVTSDIEKVKTEYGFDADNDKKYENRGAKINDENNEKQLSQKNATTIDTVNPSTDDMDSRMLQSTRQQVESLDSSTASGKEKHSNDNDNLITLQPTAAAAAVGNTNSIDTDTSNDENDNDNTNDNTIMNDEDLLTVSPTNTKNNQDLEKKCKVQ